MRQVRDVLRLKTAGVAINEIARRVGVYYDAEDACEKLCSNDPVPPLPPLTFVAKIAVLLPQGFRLGVGRRHLPIGGARRASEDKVARSQCQQSADDASLIPAKIIQRTEHFQTRAARLDPSGR